MARRASYGATTPKSRMQIARNPQREERSLPSIGNLKNLQRSKTDLSKVKSMLPVEDDFATLAKLARSKSLSKLETVDGKKKSILKSSKLSCT
ncbi:unnamed protein product [Phytophthora lilii]|uniref:Unnamed protein product n=1 Tax=Phytophthora lilii TaxID=2077276 RepID=A0A9W6WY04_9STRA|nr:unnamed protein product [Phytophthora lilii]